MTSSPRTRDPTPQSDRARLAASQPGRGTLQILVFQSGRLTLMRDTVSTMGPTYNTSASIHGSQAINQYAKAVLACTCQRRHNIHDRHVQYGFAGTDLR